MRPLQRPVRCNGRASEFAVHADRLFTPIARAGAAADDHPPNMGVSIRARGLNGTATDPGRCRSQLEMQTSARGSCRERLCCPITNACFAVTSTATCLPCLPCYLPVAVPCASARAACAVAFMGTAGSAIAGKDAARFVSSLPARFARRDG